MRQGFTTGSCAAAAAKAAAYMLLGGNRKENIRIDTPKGIPFDAQIEEISIAEDAVSCAVKKDGGDDPDVTTGAYVYAEVRYCDEAEEFILPIQKEYPKEPAIIIRGGLGVGRVTRPGLDQPVGEVAINSVPRQMITKEVTEVCELFDYRGGLIVTISIPKGVELAEQTFNPRLGIEGGISVLGTSGVVEPMSNQALLDTIRVELRQHMALGKEIICITPGNYGLDFMKKTYDFDLNQAVKCSNFIGDTLDMIAELGFSKAILVGHIGKLVKLSGGIMNTHSKEADSRMELMAAACVRAYPENVKDLPSLLPKILDCLTTEEAYAHLLEYQKEDGVMEELMKQIAFYLRKRANQAFEIECMVYSNSYGLLGKTAGAEDFLAACKGE